MAGEPRVIVLGAGHNGLAAAFYLARAGLKPLVLERREIIGGAAVTEEFYPGFRCSTLAHNAAAFRNTCVAREMRLERHGVEWIAPEPAVTALAPSGPALFLFRDLSKALAEVARLHRRDAEPYAEFSATLERLAAFLAPLLEAPPPEIDSPSAGDLFGLLKTGRGFRSLGKKDVYRLLRWAPMAVADLAAEWFESESLRAVVAARGIFGCAMGPWSAGTGAIYLLQAALDPVPAGSTAYVRGGMGALTAGMAGAAREAGAEIRTGADVAQIAVKNGAATSVVLRSGEEIPARAVISSADPRRTFLSLLDPLHLDPSFVSRLRNYRMKGAVAKLNLALDAVPQFSALSESNGMAGISSGAALAGRIHIGPEIDYLERAFDASKYGRISEAPYLEVTIPSLTDPTLAPAGKHVMSVFMQYAPYSLRDSDWMAKRDALADGIIGALAAYAPDLPDKIIALQLLTPLDLENTYALTGGHPFHGELALDQLFTMRPLLDWARYRTPVEGLFLCGSGTHPGIGLTGLSGSNATRAIARELR